LFILVDNVDIYNFSSHIVNGEGGSGAAGGEDEIQWCFSQVKGTIEDEVTDGKFLLTLRFHQASSPLSQSFSLSLTADIISTVQFNHDGEFLATGDKGGRVVIFQRDGTKMRVGL